MRLALFSKTICSHSADLIDYLMNRGISIDLVVVEKQFRRKFSSKEIQFRRSHEAFFNQFQRGSFWSRLSRNVRTRLPVSWQAILFSQAHRLPVLKKRTIINFCTKRSIPFRSVSKHSSQETRDLLNQMNVDYVVLGSTNWIIKEPLFSNVSFRILNAHPGYLPYHRGLDSNLWAIRKNDPVGITTYILDSGLDTGDILKFFKLNVKDLSGLDEYFQKIGQLKKEAIYQTILGLKNGTVSPVNQFSRYPAHEPMSLEELMETHQLLTLGAFSSGRY